MTHYAMPPVRMKLVARRVHTFSNLSFVFAYEEVFEEVTEELESAVLEGVAGTVEQLQEVQVILQMRQWHHVVRAERRVAPVDDGFQVRGRDFGGRDVEAEDLESKVGIGEVFPTPLRCMMSLGPASGLVRRSRRPKDRAYVPSPVRLGLHEARIDRRLRRVPSRQHSQRRAIEISGLCGSKAQLGPTP